MHTCTTRVVCWVWLVFFAAGSAAGQTPTTVTRSGQPRPTPRVGYNLNSQTKPSWYNPALRDSARELNLNLLRYPGGTESQFFDWQTGQSSLSSAPGRQPLTEYVYALDELGADGIFCLNLANATLEDQREMLLTAQAAGVEVRYIEMGNELWDDKASLDYASRFASAQAYADTAAAWIAALRQDFPEAEFALLSAPEDPLTPGGATTPERVLTWNDGIAGQLGAAEAVTFHYYFPLTGVSTTSPNLTQVLSKPFELWPRYRQYSLDALPAGKPVWVTEYNLNDGNQSTFVIASSWAHGLFTSSILLQLLAEPEIEMLLCHQLFGPPTWGSLQAFYTQPPDTNDLSLSAQGAALALIHRAIDASTEAEALVFGTNPVQVSGTTQFPSLVGWSFEGGDSSYTVVLNLSPTAFVAFGIGGAGSYQYQTLSHPDPLLTGLTRQDLSRVAGSQSGNLSLAPYSLTLVTAPALATTNDPVATALSARVWPNPADDWVRVALGAPGPFEVRVTSPTGQTVFWAGGIGPTLALDTTGWPAGVYLVQVVQGGQTETLRLVKG